MTIFHLITSAAWVAVALVLSAVVFSFLLHPLTPNTAPAAKVPIAALPRKSRRFIVIVLTQLRGILIYKRINKRS